MSESEITPEPESESSAMLLLLAPKLPTTEELLAAKPARRSLSVDAVTERTLALTFDGSPALVELVSTPIPWDALEGPCETAWWWPEAAEACRLAQGHLVATIEDAKLDPLERNLRLTDLLAMLAQSSAANALGVYWPDGTVVHERKSFLEQAAEASRKRLPLELWVDFREELEEDGSRFYATTGMEALGFMELETTLEQASEQDAIGMLFNVAHYLCDNGPILNDGDTIGLSEEQRLLIRHRKSLWARPGTVIALEFDTSAAPPPPGAPTEKSELQ